MSVVEREVQVVPEVQRPITEREHRARTLEGAALEIEVRGWTRKRHCSDRGEVCLAGGVLAALGNDIWSSLCLPSHGQFSPVWWGYAREEGENWPVSIPDWNDADDRTAKEVTDLLRWRASEIRDGR